MLVGKNHWPLAAAKVLVLFFNQNAGGSLSARVFPGDASINVCRRS
jgi:hypothetical protein